MTQTHPSQIRIPATYIRGGTSKGVFFNLSDLPVPAQKPGPSRDALLMRVIGSPDPYGKHTDGMAVPLRAPAKLSSLVKASNLGTTSITCSVKSPSINPSWIGAVTVATCQPRSALLLFNKVCCLRNGFPKTVSPRSEFGR